MGIYRVQNGIVLSYRVQKITMVNNLVHFLLIVLQLAFLTLLHLRHLPSQYIQVFAFLLVAE